LHALDDRARRTLGRDESGPGCSRR
jgi:hypothetical protein